MTAINSSTALATDDHIQRVHNLPPELYDKIYDFTFTNNFRESYYIDEKYKPPNILQVNKQQHSTLHQAFYNQTIFTVSDSATDMETLTRWLRSLPDPREHSEAKMVAPTLHILSRSIIGTNSHSRNESAPSWADLSEADHDKLRIPRERLYTVLDHLHSGHLNRALVLFTIRVERKARFRFLTEEGCEIWWDRSLNHSIPNPVSLQVVDD